MSLADTQLHPTRWYAVAKSHQDHQGWQREQLQTSVSF